MCMCGCELRNKNVFVLKPTRACGLYVCEMKQHPHKYIQASKFKQIGSVEVETGRLVP